MTWADPRQLIADAQAGGYAVGGFNMHSDETAQALVRAAEQAESPMFLQVGRAIVPHVGVRAAAELTRRAAAESGAQLVARGAQEDVLVCRYAQAGNVDGERPV